MRISLQQYRASAPLELTALELSNLLAAYGSRLDIRPTGDGRVTVAGIHHVGVIRSDSLQLVITPKVPSASVFWMLGFVDRLLRFEPEDFEFELEAGLLDIVARLFARQTEHVVRRGLYRQYLERTDNLRHIRGRLALFPDARTNLGLRHKVVCDFTEYTADVVDNRVLRAVTEQLLRYEYRLPGISQQLRWNAAHLEEVALSPVTERDFRAITYGRLNNHYRAVHAIGRLIVRNLTFHLDAGRDAAPSFLLDMNQVYQEFLTRLLEEAARPLHLRLHKSDGLHLDLLGRIRIKPDILFADDRSIRIAIDAKYKRHDPESDVYQAVAYAKGLGLKAVALVYPADGEVVPVTHVIRNDDLQVLVRTVPIGHGGLGFPALERQALDTMSALLRELISSGSSAAAA